MVQMNSLAFQEKRTALFSQILFPVRQEVLQHLCVLCVWPSSDEEIAKTIGVYGRMGLPGMIGSTDGVHIR